MSSRPTFFRRHTRRTWLAAAAMGLVGGASTGARTPGRRPRIALLCTEIRLRSHGQHFLDRLAVGYALGGRWHTPRVEIAGVFVDQRPAKDLSGDRLQRYGLREFPTVEEAVTLGGERLAVDGVVIIGEHGDYPRNELGQTRYPRHAWFKRVVQVFADSGRSVPVFNDKHLSTSWDECLEMVADSRRLGFPMLAGSALPVTFREPEVDVPAGAPLTESVCVGFGALDSYDFHALEAAQCMSERRRGGETGVASVQAVRGGRLWDALAAADRGQTRELLLAALSRSHSLPAADGYVSGPPSFAWARAALSESIGYLYEHRDGFRTTVVLAPINDFNYAGRRADTGAVVSCQLRLPMPGHEATTADFFNPLVHHIENLVLEERAAYPVERTLLTSGMLIEALESLHAGGAVRRTPRLDVAYPTVQPSTFWRG